MLETGVGKTDSGMAHPSPLALGRIRNEHTNKGIFTEEDTEDIPGVITREKTKLNFSTNTVQPEKGNINRNQRLYEV